ncbi:MAG TPA: alpha/beta fold hydrolase, partial [Stellaceae bacterium]|nr:alpha/beta fold hydrolase [Stellaceae bacterium]
MIAVGYPFWSDVWIRSGWRVQTRGGVCRLLDDRDRLVCRGTRKECIALARGLAPRARRRRSAILLHGLGRSRRFMRILAEALEGRGWAVATPGYASLSQRFDAHVRAVRSIADALVEDGAEEVDLIGHSLGGLIARAAMDESWPGGRCVLIGAPNRGAQMAERIRRIPLGRLLLGPCAEALMPEAAAALPVPAAPILVIAGGNGGRGWNPLLPGDDDFTVGVEETRLGDAETRFVRVRSLHFRLPMHRDVVS